jgi:hypothetical protein
MAYIKPAVKSAHGDFVYTIKGRGSKVKIEYQELRIEIREIHPSCIGLRSSILDPRPLLTLNAVRGAFIRLPGFLRRGDSQR